MEGKKKDWSTRMVVFLGGLEICVPWSLAILQNKKGVQSIECHNFHFSFGEEESKPNVGFRRKSCIGF